MMKIIISPAKKMNVDMDTLAPAGQPVFLKEAEELLQWLRRLSLAEAKAVWNCSDRIAEQNYRRIEEMDLKRNLTPAVIAYEGIQYQYMAPAVFGGRELDYIQEHLRILSGFYGVLKPLDGVVPYRLEMQAKASDAGDLYRFWGGKLYREVTRGKDQSQEKAEQGREGQKKGTLILNLASKEYSRSIEKYLQPEDRLLNCVFGELEGGRVRQKGTLAKMARGEMVRYLAEHRVEEPEEIQGFCRLGYRFEEKLSGENEYIFLKSSSGDGSRKEWK